MDSKKSLIKNPSVWLPLLMSSVVLAVMLYYFTRVGIVREADEGVGAHVFQILMPLQLPIIVFFVTRYLPKQPKEASMILILQLAAAFIVCFPVFYFQL